MVACGSYVLPLADTAGSVNAGGLLSSPAWQKGQDLLQTAGDPGCQVLCPRMELSPEHGLARQVALYLEYSPTLRVYNSACFVEL